MEMSSTKGNSDDQLTEWVSFRTKVRVGMPGKNGYELSNANHDNVLESGAHGRAVYATKPANPTHST